MWEKSNFKIILKSQIQGWAIWRYPASSGQNLLWSYSAVPRESREHLDLCGDEYSLSMRVQTMVNHIRFVTNRFVTKSTNHSPIAWRREGHTSGCNWWISIRSVINTQDWRKFWKRFRGCFVSQSRVSTKTVVIAKRSKISCRYSFEVKNPLTKIRVDELFQLKMHLICH